MAKKNVKVTLTGAIPVPIEEPEEECPKCPAVGAPPWMATFADMATLLMAFFVLILSFAEFNTPKFKMISGSMRNAFGIQREVPIVEPPKGTTVLSLDFSPSPNPSLTKELTQQTTEIEQPEVDLKTKENDGTDGDASDDAPKKPDSASSDAPSPEDMLKALRDAIERGDIELEVNGSAVEIIKAKEPDKLGVEDLLQQLTDQLENERNNNSPNDPDSPLAGLEDELAYLAELARSEKENAPLSGALEDGPEGERPATGAMAKARAQAQAALALEEVKVALQQEIGQGLVMVEQDEGKLLITVGAGGAFPSGSADLTGRARDIMERIAYSAMTTSNEITVSGHTDSVPLTGNGEFHDNWDLASARSASIVREVLASGLVDGGQITAVSYGETRPIAENETPEGREKNRRIEIEIVY